MIGNDLVDLKLAAQQSNWRRKGFLNKVFSLPEQQLITVSNTPHITVWLLWSMKEAAYKAHQREFNLPRKLNWLAQECILKEFNSQKASGEVLIKGSQYYTTSEINSDFIYTSAENFKNTGVKNEIFEASSSKVKMKLLEEVSKNFFLPQAQLELKKDGFGMPFLSCNESFLFDQFSISGHGRFAAYNLSLINCETPVKHS